MNAPTAEEMLQRLRAVGIFPTLNAVGVPVIHCPSNDPELKQIAEMAAKVFAHEYRRKAALAAIGAGASETTL